MGWAAIRWTTLDPSVTPDTLDYFRVALIAALYSEVLVIDSDHRADLSGLVAAAIDNWRVSDPNGTPANLEFQAWDRDVLGLGSMPLWPWQVVEPNGFDARMKVVPPAFGNPIIYTATLKSGPTTSRAPAGVWAFTEMPMSLSKICVPSSPLIAAYAFGRESIATDRPEAIFPLCFLLDQVNSYYQELGNASASINQLVEKQFVLARETFT